MRLRDSSNHQQERAAQDAPKIKGTNLERLPSPMIPRLANASSGCRRKRRCVATACSMNRKHNARVGSALLWSVFMALMSFSPAQAFQFPARLPRVIRSFFLKRNDRPWGMEEDNAVPATVNGSPKLSFPDKSQSAPPPSQIATTSTTRQSSQNWSTVPPSKQSKEETFTPSSVTTSNTQQSSNASGWKDPKMWEKKLQTQQVLQHPRPHVETGKVCRVVTLSDGMIPLSRVPPPLLEEPYILRKLDDIYHSMSHEETRRLRYMDRPDIEGIEFFDESEERKLVSVVRNSLKDAGFELLSQRDLDLCDSLNAGYLLRLSIVPDVKDLDPDITQEFYPEWFTHNKTMAPKDMLFDGKVLIYWRGYDTEVTRGRLLLAKLDYVQTKLVQSAAFTVKKRLETVERLVGRGFRKTSRSSLAWSLGRTRAAVDAVPLLQALGARRRLRRLRPSARRKQERPLGEEDSFFQLARYGGSKQRLFGADPLEPFLIYESDAEEYCELRFDETDNELQVNGKSTNGEKTVANGTFSEMNGLTNTTDVVTVDQADEEFYECINHSELRCPYDQEFSKLPPMQLLRRVSMNNVVDLFSREGWRNLFSSLFAKTELVEPTYKEVVVIWRPKRPKSKRRIKPPQFVYEVADLFDLEGLEPPKAEVPKPLPLEIRTFDGTPLANLNAVFPKSKLVFRPADAFVFDLVSIVSLGLVFSSQRFDNARLDVLALASVIFWLVRLALRYSNKLARYDLLVKNFLTSKISHRNAGALKYLAAEAGSQRAIRAALVHDWLCQQSRSPSSADALYVDRILSEGPSEINELVKDKQADVDMQAALNDLEDLKLLRLEWDMDGRCRVVVTCAPSAVESRLRQAWNAIFQGGLSLNFLTGRR